jgi:beta-aspartyl-dipeptidase (metallo-type)
MLTILKNIEVFSPAFLSRRDIFIAGSTISKIAPVDAISCCDTLVGRLIDCTGLRALPGIIDQHMHILGGGGEQSFASRLPELTVDEIAGAGVTTLVGLLGADNITRSMDALYAKAKSLEAQGITTYLYSGSYALPLVTFTDSVIRDLVLIDKVIGAGEIAISDHRASPFPFDALKKVAADVHLGGLLGGKAGVLHLHVGDGKGGLAPVKQLIKSTDLPPEQFVPTHVNRNPALFEEAVQYCLGGGHIDLTAGETAGISVPDALAILTERGASLANVTVSSDAGGSIPSGGSAKAHALFDDIIGCIRKGMPVENAFSVVTENVARLLKLYPKKGVLAQGSDADLLIIDAEFNIRLLICMGRTLVENL